MKIAPIQQSQQTRQPQKPPSRPTQMFMAGALVGTGTQLIVEKGLKSQAWSNPFSAQGKGFVARLKTVTPFFVPVILFTAAGFYLKEQEKNNPNGAIYKFLDKCFDWAR